MLQVTTVTSKRVFTSRIVSFFFFFLNCPGVRLASENSQKQKPHSPGFWVRQTHQMQTGLRMCLCGTHDFATWSGEERPRVEVVQVSKW